MSNGGKRTPGRGVWAMALANFDSWLRSPRTVLPLLFIAAICYLQMCGYAMTLEETGYTMHLGETLFYEFNFGCNMPMTTALFLIMVCELPRRTAYQQLMMIRSSRCRWMAAQLLYGVMMVVCMLALLLALLSLMAAPLVTAGTGWSDAARIASGQIEPHEALIDAVILDNLSPLTALLLAMAPLFLFWLTMVYVILLFGVWGAPVVGLLAYAFLMVAHVTIQFEAFPFRLRLPMHYATLRNILSGRDAPEVARIFAVYAALIAGLVAAMMASAGRIEMNFHEESRP